ncbi:helix-turn-helix transcriptional regulator [Cohnella sp. WQ 127256]|uniref:helix-turn-helix transcriptional regulator n=1 Tax=Cohnella sp. WQ 127256 TaxID=2938790 RepID=UPI002117D175|nr:AraC family transcriptional regulator [Cohnella sp. WQ 127256]
MVQLWTEGKTHHSGYRIGITYSAEETLCEDDGEERIGYRILLINEGVGVIHVGSTLYPIVAPGIYCFTDKEKVSFIAGAPLKVKSIRFSLNALNERLDSQLKGLPEGAEQTTTDFQDLWVLETFLERTEAYYGCLFLDPSVAKRAEEIIEEIGSNLSIQPDSFWPCRSRSYLMELLFMIRLIYQKSDFTPSAIPQAVSETIRPVIEYLHTHYKEKIKIENLTSAFHVNKTTLNDWFRKSTGLSVISYLGHIRMRMADPLLRNTTLPTTEIMERVGIRDDAHFIRKFRQYSGYSPAEYRTKYCWMLKK